MLHAYCIRRSDDPPPRESLVGVGGKPVRLLVDGALGIWVSESDGAEASIGRLREHELVVRSALESATPLPMRFGTLFRSEERALAALAERRDEFVELLASVADHLEMAVRVSVVGEEFDVSVEEPAGGPAESGTAYLRRRREEIRRKNVSMERAATLLGELLSELDHPGVPGVVNVAPRNDFAGTLAHLVHRAEVRLYRDSVARLQERRPDVCLAVSGPWAPYSFVSR